MSKLTKNIQQILHINDMTNIVKETDQFIQALITIIRDEKINTLINGSES